MNFEQRAAIKFSFTETHQMLQQAYGDACLSRTQIYEWYTRFKSGREDINDDERPGRPKTGLSAEHIEKVRDFIKMNSYHLAKQSLVNFSVMY